MRVALPYGGVAFFSVSVCGRVFSVFCFRSRDVVAMEGRSVGRGCSWRRSGVIFSLLSLPLSTTGVRHLLAHDLHSSFFVGNARRWRQCTHRFNAGSRNNIRLYKQ